MYIGRIDLQNWKNFKRTSAVLRRRVFLIGPNASGKSNLLDAMRFLRDLAQVGLRQATEHRGGLSQIRCLAARESPNVSVGVTLLDEDDRPAWEYRVEFNQDLARVPKLRSETVRDLKTDRVVISRPDEKDDADALRLTQTALEQIVANQGFREIAEFFSTITYQHVVPQAVRDPKDFSTAPVANDPFGRDLLLRIWNTTATTRTAWLKRISTVLKQAVPQLQSLDIEMDRQGTPHLIGRYEHWRAHGARQTEAQFSDGTLRLFGLMWSMFEGAGPLLLEEPELSLHPAVVRLLPHLLHGLQEQIRKMKRKATHSARQIIISTHSDDLLSDMGIAAEEVVRIEASAEGSVLYGPTEEEKALLRQGMNIADIMLPRAAPGQLVLGLK